LRMPMSSSIRRRSGVMAVLLDAVDGNVLQAAVPSFRKEARQPFADLRNARAVELRLPRQRFSPVPAMLRRKLCCVPALDGLLDVALMAVVDAT
jgi:hypothetical protein